LDSVILSPFSTHFLKESCISFPAPFALIAAGLPALSVETLAVKALHFFATSTLMADVLLDIARNSNANERKSSEI
jgi:hypothetical protein